MWKIKRIMNRMLSAFLIGALLVVQLGGCTSFSNITNTQQSSDVSIETEELVSKLVSQIQEDIESDGIEDYKIEKLVSENWEDYYGDVETFIYGLLSNEMGCIYDVFPAYVELSDGTTISGIGYTDYQDCYVNDESQCIFLAGLLPYYGEIPIPEEEFENGLIIHDMDYENDDFTFLLAYEKACFSEHCVVFNQYIKYGVNNDGVIYIDQDNYKEDTIDKALGTLYSFDEAKYLYDVNFEKHVSLTGESLSTQFDYALIEREINRVLENQDINFSDIDIASYAYASQEALIAYFLTLQEETFLGYQVSSLIEIAEQLDPLECLRLTGDGLTVVDIEPMPKEGETALVKWIIGSGCAMLAAVAMVGAVVFVECPPLSALSGAIAGTAIEVFMQVVIENEKIENINWTKVAIAAVSGAVSGFLGPYIMATYGGVTQFVVDSALDGLIGAIEQSIYTWIDGGAGKEIATSFGMGFAMGFGLSAGFKGIGKAVNIMAKKITPAITKVGEKLYPISKKVGKVVEKISKGMGEQLIVFQEALEKTPFHSEYVANKMTWKNLERILNEGDEELAKKAFNQLGVDNIYDKNGKAIDKKVLKEMFGEATDDSVIGYFEYEGEKVVIKKQNGMVGIYYDKKYQTVAVKNRLKVNRAENFEEGAKEFKKLWTEDTSGMPEVIKNAIEAKGTTIKDIDAKALSDIIQKSDWVMHENIDMKTITLVPSSIHKGISHMGGRGLAKYVKMHMGQLYFERFVSQAASSAVASY